MPSVHFLDVTNRDGVQTARTGLSKFGKVMVNYYLGRLGVAQSEIGFPFLFHEVPYVRACLALAEAGAFGDLRLSGWCRAVSADVEAAELVRDHLVRGGDRHVVMAQAPATRSGDGHRGLDVRGNRPAPAGQPQVAERPRLGQRQAGPDVRHLVEQERETRSRTAPRRGAPGSS